MTCLERHACCHNASLMPNVKTCRTSQIMIWSPTRSNDRRSLDLDTPNPSASANTKPIATLSRQGAVGCPADIRDLVLAPPAGCGTFALHLASLDSTAIAIERRDRSLALLVQKIPYKYE